MFVSRVVVTGGRKAPSELQEVADALLVEDLANPELLILMGSMSFEAHLEDVMEDRSSRLSSLGRLAAGKARC